MQKKLTWVLTMTALALFAFIYFIERNVPGTEERAAAPRLFPRIGPQDVTALEITLPSGGVVRAEQTNGTWFLTKPLYPAEQSLIETFVTNVTRLKRFDRIPQHEVVLQGQKSFGFDPARAKVVLETATNRVQLEIGGNAPLTNNLYLRVAPSADVVLAQAEVLETLPRTTNDWRSGRLLQLERIPFDTLQVRTGQRMFELRQNPTNNLWQITRPIPARADQSQMAILFDQLGRAQVGGFVADGAVPLESYGLQTPDVTVGFNQGTNRQFTVEFGGAATNRTNQVFARLLGNTNIVTVSRDVVDFLRQPYKAFHDPRLLTFENPAALDRIEVKFLENFAVRRQADGRWRVGEEDGFAADVELLGEFLRKIVGLRILDIAKEVPTEADLQALGLQKPIAMYSFLAGTTNAAGVATNVLYSALSFGTNTVDRIYVTRSDETPIYITEFAKFLELPRFAYELRDRQIWTVATGEVTRVSIVGPTGTNSATRAGGIWSSDPVANEVIGESVVRLSHLEALRWVAKNEDLKQSLAIGTERIEMEVRTAAGTEVKRVQLGKLTMRRDVYAEHPEVPALIFEFSGEIYHLLKQNLPAAR